MRQDKSHLNDNFTRKADQCPPRPSPLVTNSLAQILQRSQAEALPLFLLTKQAVPLAALVVT